MAAMYAFCLVLANFGMANESYFADYNTYGTYGNVNAAGLFASTTDVALVSTDATATGFSATATHAAAAGKTCGVFVGNATPVGGITVEGEVNCW